MATTRTLLRNGARRGMLAMLTGPMLGLGGCAAGSSASFTQAPLLFAEQSDAPGGAPVASGPAVRAPDALLGAAAAPPTYVAIGGNAILPTAAVTSIMGPLGAAIAQAGSPHAIGATAVAATVALQIAPGGATAGVAVPVAGLAAQAGVSGGSASVGVQIGGLASVAVQTNIPGVVASTTAGVTQLASTVPAIVPVLASPAAALMQTVGTATATIGSATTALLQPPVATALASTPALLAPPKALLVSAPVLAVGAARSTAVTGATLLAATGGSAARICLLKGCR